MLNLPCYSIIIIIANILPSYYWKTGKQRNGIPEFKFRLATSWLEDLTQLLNLLQLQFPYLLTGDSKNTCPTAHKIIVNIRQDKLCFVSQKHCENVIFNYSYTSVKQCLWAFPDAPKQMRYHPTCTARHAFPIISPNTPCFSTTSIHLCVHSTKLQIPREQSPCLFVHHCMPSASLLSGAQ